MNILKEVCEKKDEKFKFVEIDQEKMYNHIQKAKASKTTADDALSMDILKQIPKIMSEILTTIFNLIITTKTFPKALKKARVIPLKKPS